VPSHKARPLVGFLLGTHPSARDPSSPAAIIRFAGIGVVVYILLIIFQPALHQAYGYWFRAFGDVVFHRVGGVGSVHFLDLHSQTLFQDLDEVTPGDLPANFDVPKADGEKDTLLVLQSSKAPGSVGLFRSGSRMMAYIPTALFFALFVATPLPVLKRVVLLVAGFVVLHLFLVLRMWVYVTNVGFADPGKKYHIYEPGDLSRDLLRRADKVLADDPTFNYIVPVLVWLVVVLGINFWTRRRELAALKAASRNRRG